MTTYSKHDKKEIQKGEKVHHQYKYDHIRTHAISSTTTMWGNDTCIHTQGVCDSQQYDLLYVALTEFVSFICALLATFAWLRSRPRASPPNYDSTIVSSLHGACNWSDWQWKDRVRVQIDRKRTSLYRSPATHDNVLRITVNITARLLDTPTPGTAGHRGFWRKQTLAFDNRRSDERVGRKCGKPFYERLSPSQRQRRIASSKSVFEKQKNENHKFQFTLSRSLQEAQRRISNCNRCITRTGDLWSTRIKTRHKSRTVICSWNCVFVPTYFLANGNSCTSRKNECAYKALSAGAQ